MRILATSVGSAGDFLPTLAVAAVLGRRGHDVTVVANPFYESRIRAAGLRFVAAGEILDLNEAVQNRPDFIDPVRGGAKLFDELLVPNLVAVYETLGRLLDTDRPDIVLGNNVSFSAFWAAAERGVPSVNVHATPLAWASPLAPMVLSDWTPPRFLQPVLTTALRWLIAWFLGRKLRPIARRLGTKIPDPSYVGTEALAARQLGLWSGLLRGPVATDPFNGVICGSARASVLGGESAGNPPEVEAFLSAGTPPVAVGLGSVFSLVMKDVLVNLAEASAKLGMRCLIIGHPAGAVFPSNTLAVRYAPYNLVFPRSAVAVVHGGAGSTGEALRSGRPSIVVPFGYDQYWMGTQVERLGVGVRVRLAKRRVEDFVDVLQHVLGDELMGQRAAERHRAFSGEADGAEIGADEVEKLVRQTAMRVGA